MEFVRVTYPGDRRVRVDHQPQGRTNTVIRVERGRHHFDLGLPPDYEPPYDERVVTGTSFAAPLELAFSPAAGILEVPESPETPEPDSSAGVEPAATPASSAATTPESRARPPRARRRRKRGTR